VPPDARAYLFSLEQIGIKLGLDQIHSLLAALGRPELAFPSIVVAGTNGKGSTAAMIERGLRAAGYRTARYTSPHLVAIEERFAIDGVAIDAATFDHAAERVRAVATGLAHPPSFFEATTALALDVFRSAAVDVAVLEVGLGGRLDATNAVPAVAAVITMVDYDHQQYLGHTLEAIAAEKAGVIKRGQLVVLGRNPAPVAAVVHATCASRDATLVRAWEEVGTTVEVTGGPTTITMTTPVRRYASLRLGLRGRHQIDNAVTAVRTLEVLDAAGTLRVPASAIRAAVEAVIWPGRLELVQAAGGPVLLDGAHNPAGATTLATYILDTYGHGLPIVLGVMADKDIDAIVRALAPAATRVVTTSASSPRAARAADVAAVVRRVAPHLPVTVAPTPADGVRQAREHGDPVVVAGSLYLVGEIRALL
jgi:dihydrofolate synthase/folylpolyglutamate synthase